MKLLEEFRWRGIAQDASDDTGAAAEIEDAIRRTKRPGALDEVARVALEGGGHEQPLEDVREVREALCVFHDPWA